MNIKERRKWNISDLFFYAFIWKKGVKKLPKYASKLCYFCLLLEVIYNPFKAILSIFYIALVDIIYNMANKIFVVGMFTKSIMTKKRL